MRHRAFTLVEVLAALSIIIVTGLLGGYSYGRLTTHLSEQQFLRQFQLTWRQFNLRPEPARVRINDRTVSFESPIGQVKRKLTLPAHFEPVTSTIRVNKTTGLFAEPTTIQLVRRDHSRLIVTFQMGWGELNIYE